MAESRARGRRRGSWRGGGLRETFLDVAKAVPASLQLVYRLVRDERVDERRRAAMVAALAYAVLPFDFIPDRIPVIGRIDDVVVVGAALQSLVEAAGEEVVAEHWEGSPGSLHALLGVVETVSSFVPGPLRRLLRFGS